MEFHRANHVSTPQSSTCVQPRDRWSPPPADTLKVNFDGATFKDIGKAGLGIVIRNSLGQATASLSEPTAVFPFLMFIGLVILLLTT
nr:hypothetical protein CFP56_51072 [Quercus suber]